MIELSFARRYVGPNGVVEALQWQGDNFVELENWAGIEAFSLDGTLIAVGHYVVRSMWREWFVVARKTFERGYAPQSGAHTLVAAGLPYVGDARVTWKTACSCGEFTSGKYVVRDGAWRAGVAHVRAKWTPGG